jgi:hypothetical protein
MKTEMVGCDDVAALAELVASDETLERATEPLARLCASGLVREALDRELRRYCDGGAPERYGGAGEFDVVSTPQLRMRAVLRRIGVPRAAHVSTVTRRTVLANGGRAPFLVQRYRQPQPEPIDVFDPARRLEPPEGATLAPGATVVLRPAIDAIEIVALDRTAVPVFAAGPVVVPLAWWYDCRTLQPVRAKPANKSWLRLRELLAFAEAVPSPSLLPALRALEAHPSHFIRWQSAALALRLDREAGLEAMRALADDPHPQLRAAARAMAEASCR